MKQDYYRILEDFCQDSGKIKKWVECASIHQVITMYFIIKNDYYELKEMYGHKGVYKSIRCIFVKHCAEKFSRLIEWWDELPASLCMEILYKTRQRRIERYLISSHPAFERTVKNTAIEWDYPDKPHLLSCYGEKNPLGAEDFLDDCL